MHFLTLPYVINWVTIPIDPAPFYISGDHMLSYSCVNVTCGNIVQKSCDSPVEAAFYPSTLYLVCGSQIELYISLLNYKVMNFLPNLILRIGEIQFNLLI